MATTEPIQHTMVAKSKPSAVEGICRSVLSELRANHYDQSDVFAVHLAIEEALTNAIKHGCKNDPSREIKVDYRVSREKVEITITDDGEGFDPDAIPDPRHGRNIYKTDGRGLLLMHSYMDVVTYNEKGNSVNMIRYRERPRLRKNAINRR